MTSETMAVVLNAGRRTEKNMRRVLREHYLSISQFLVLHQLATDGSATATALRDVIVTDNVALVTMTTRSMKKRQLISVTKGPDGRSKYLHITKAGRDMLAEIDRDLEDARL